MATWIIIAICCGAVILLLIIVIIILLCRRRQKSKQKDRLEQLYLRNYDARVNSTQETWRANENGTDDMGRVSLESTLHFPELESVAKALGHFAKFERNWNELVLRFLMGSLTHSTFTRFIM